MVLTTALFISKRRITNSFNFCQCSRQKDTIFFFQIFQYSICIMEYIFMFINLSHSFYLWIDCSHLYMVRYCKSSLYNKKILKNGPLYLWHIFSFSCLILDVCWTYISHFYIGNYPSFHVKFTFPTPRLWT